MNLDFLNYTEHLEEIGTKLSDFEEIPKKDQSYFILGKGNFGYAEKMKSKKDGKFYAIKKIDENSEKSRNKDFKRETRIMITLSHKNLIRLYGYFEDIEKIEKFKEIYKNKKNKQNIEANEDKKVCCLVMEFASNGTLKDYYEKYKLSKENYKNGEIIDEKELKSKSEDEIEKMINENFIPLDEKILIKFFKQLLDATKYLHNKNIIHRDIKPDNILLDENNNIKISDFGLSAIVRNPLDENQNNLDNALFMACSMTGPIKFVCPELISKQNYSFETDIYSLGLTMLCLMSFRYPIEIIIINGKKKRVIHIKYMLNHYNEYLRNLVLRMINDIKEYRPNANDAYDELTKIEKYIENPEENESLKSFLDNKKNLGTNMQKSSMSNTISNIKAPDIQNNNPNIIQNSPFPMGYSPMMGGPMTNQFKAPWQMGMMQPVMGGQMTNQSILPSQLAMQPMMGGQIPNPFKGPGQMGMQPINKPEITILIRVFQCLCGCFDDIGPIDNLKFVIKYWYKNRNIHNYKLLDILDILSLSDNPDDNYIKLVKNFREEYNLQNYFKGEITPDIIFYDIINMINYEYEYNKIPYNSTIFSELETIKGIPGNYLPKILEKIKCFEQSSSPCINNFYYLYLEISKCHSCNKILEVSNNSVLKNNFLTLPAEKIGNLNCLIKYHMIEETEKSFPFIKGNCKNCGSYNGVEKSFLNTPNYLLIYFRYFRGFKKVEKHLDEQLDLTEYKLTNRGPNKYLLYAFITKSDCQYKAFVKEADSWVSYSDETTKDKMTSISFDCIPYFAIYKGIILN